MSDTPNDAKKANPVDDLVFRYSMLTDEDRRAFDRKYAAFRNVRRQFSGVFDRMARKPAPQAPRGTEPVR